MTLRRHHAQAQTSGEAKRRQEAYEESRARRDSAGSFPRCLESQCVMVNWHRFEPCDFEYDFESDKLAVHQITFEEAVECFFSDFEVRRNKRYKDRYQLTGRTVGGRTLKIIFQLKPDSVVRIITGWDI